MSTRKRIVVLSGAGISAESGIATFRDSNGLCEGHDVMEVASPQGWDKNQELVLDFYNQRRKQARTVIPNQGHLLLAELETYHDIHIITQNVDDLHEQAGSTNVLHLHGSLFESQSTKDPDLTYPITGWELNSGDLCELGSQLRPNIVWFGEGVPEMEPAIELASQADFFIVVGTSMQVYPAAGLISYVPDNAGKFIIDPNKPEVPPAENLTFIEEKGTLGVKTVFEMLIAS